MAFLYIFSDKRSYVHSNHSKQLGQLSVVRPNSMKSSDTLFVKSEWANLL